MGQTAVNSLFAPMMKPVMEQSLLPLSHPGLMTLGFSQEIVMGQRGRLASVPHPPLCLAGSKSRGITSCPYTVITRMSAAHTRTKAHIISQRYHGAKMQMHTERTNEEHLQVNVYVLYVICQAYGRSPARPRPPPCDRWRPWPGSGRYLRPR